MYLIGKSTAMIKVCNTGTAKWYEFDITATWTSVQEGITLFVSIICEDDSAKFNPHAAGG